MDKVLLNKDSVTGRRIGAFILDQFLITIISMIPIMLNFSELPTEYTNVCELYPQSMLIATVCFLCKDLIGGRSLGKLVFGIYVREYDNAAKTPKFFKLLLRNVFVLIWFVEFIIMLVDNEGRRLGDKMAKTRVIGYQKSPVLGIILSCVTAFALFVSTVFFTVNQFIKNDSSYKAAIAYIEEQPETTRAIGEIEGYGYFPMGNVSITNGYGEADLSIKVIGEQKSIIVRVIMEKTPDSKWTVIDSSYHYCE